MTSLFKARFWQARGGLWIGLFAFALTSVGLVALSPANAQFSSSYTFLKAVKDRDGAKAKPLLDVPGSVVVNTKDPATGETGLLIATRRRDLPWMGFLLQHDARTDIRDNQGETPLTAAARIGYAEGAQLLLQAGANPNLATTRGETPLIVAVQGRDAAIVRMLIGAGADPKLSDSISGMNARDYALRDGARSAPLVKLLDEAKPRADPKKVAGPGL